MIKLEDDDVSLAAIHARMLSKVVDDLLAHLRAPLRDVSVDSSSFTFMVLPIIPRVGFGEALTTPRLQLRLATPHRRKSIKWLQFAAFRARSHEGERADTSKSVK
ncbi:MAG TPA: hypothetical protein VEN31_13095 [Candidatus Bathyarchaeia archaeon]|nr:hypothetical protein [Candidatus Bathyarchaeia archaeon]